MGVELRALVIIEAWHNPRFLAELEKNPRQAVEKLAAREGLDPAAAAGLEIAGENGRLSPLFLPPNPVGASPAEIRRVRARKEATLAEQPTVKIHLSPEQREAVRQATGREVAWLELTPEALEEGPVLPSAVRAGMGLPSTWDC